MEKNKKKRAKKWQNLVYNIVFYGKFNYMELVKGTTYFDKTENKIKQYPYLDEDIECEVLIIGGGIEGATLNRYLSKDYDVVLVEGSRLARNSTCVSTALLEFQLDSFANDLLKTLTKEEIVEVYKMGLNSIKEIEKLMKEYGNKCNFKRKSALLYSNIKSDIKKLEDEYLFRINNGFDCEFINEENNPFEFEIKAGILDKNGGAEFNPYLFSKQMIENSLNQNKIFENTKIIRIEQDDEFNYCFTEHQNVIKCKKVVLATGFNLTLLDENVKKLLTQQVSFSIVTNKSEKVQKIKDVLIQDCLENYHYLRTLPDDRIIFGGEDAKFSGEIDEKLSNLKYESLLKKLKELLKDENLKAEFSFCGLFITTENNLGIIGKSENKNIYYFLSCGANGIINTFCGVDIIQDLLKNKKNYFEKFFSPLRKV